MTIIAIGIDPDQGKQGWRNQQNLTEANPIPFVICILLFWYEGEERNELQKRKLTTWGGGGGGGRTREKYKIK